MFNPDVIVFATPIYYYEMSGQMKTLLDRAIPLYNSEYKFRDIYLLSSAADNDKHAADKAVTGLEGWIACFEKACLKGSILAGGINDARDINGSFILEKTYETGSEIY